MKKFEKYLKSAMREKAPDSWDKIEATAKENIPQKEAKKRNFKFIYSPASLMICAVIVIAAIAVVPNLDRIFNPVPTTASSESTFSYESTDGSTTGNHGIADTTTEATIPTTEGTTTATTIETTRGTIATTDGTMIETTDTTSGVETIVTSTTTPSATSTTGIPEYAHEKREATFENEYGSYSVKYKYYTDSAVYGKIKITEITVISGSEFMLEPAFMLEGRSVDLPAEIFIENKTGATLKKFIFAEGIKAVFAEVSDGAESIYVPASLENINPSHMSSGKSVFFADNLTRIDVSEESNTYASENGVLFSKDKTALIRFPAAHTEKRFIIQRSVSEVYVDAFTGADLDALTVHGGISEIHFEHLHIGRLYLSAPSINVICGDGAVIDSMSTLKKH